MPPSYLLTFSDWKVQLAQLTTGLPTNSLSASQSSLLEKRSSEHCYRSPPRGKESKCCYIKIPPTQKDRKIAHGNVNQRVSILILFLLELHLYQSALCFKFSGQKYGLSSDYCDWQTKQISEYSSDKDSGKKMSMTLENSSFFPLPCSFQL